MAVSYDYYRIFYHVVQQKSFTQAAKVLGNNQPNITRCMNNLEYELGCKLFIRSKRGITLTPEGERLYQHVAIAYQQLSQGEDEIRRNCSLESGTISVSVSEAALHLLLLDKLSDFHTMYPGVKLRISNDTTPKAINDLACGRTDYAVVTTPYTLPAQLKATSLMSFDSILLCGNHYETLAQEKRSLQDIHPYPFICMGPNSGSYEFCQRIFIKHDLTFHLDMEAATMDQILPMIQYNLGVGFFPQPLAQQALDLGIVFQVHLNETLPHRSVSLVENTSRPQSMAMKAFHQLLCKDILSSK